MDEQKALERKIKRLQTLLNIYRVSLAVAVVVIGLLLGFLLLGKAPCFGRCIFVDGQAMAMVRDEQAADKVRETLLARGRGELPGEATFRQKWEDEARPRENARILSIAEAVRVLEPKFTVVVEAYAIEVDGRALAVVPTKEFATNVLDKLKSRYASSADAVVKVKKLRPEPEIRPTTASPDEIVADIGAAVELLARARSQQYTIRSGDYPERIASRFKMTLDEFWSLNPQLKGQTLQVGKTVQVLGEDSGLVVVTVKEAVTTETLEPPVERQSTTSLQPGETKVADPGQPGRQRVRWEIISNNDKEVSRQAISREVIEAPQAKRVLTGAKKE